MKTALVIMAAGIGSRFGKGIKQLTPVGPAGEIIMDYSIYDALEAGFDEVVFIIRKDMKETFRKMIGERIEKVASVKYAYQELSDLPGDHTLPEGRVKPWGTGQAVLACRDVVKDPFVVINADDYYGKRAFVLLHDYLTNHPAHTDGIFDICMAGFILKNTLSENGTVTRGICRVNDRGELTEVNETKNIRKIAGGAETVDADGTVRTLDPENHVSMNMWGFSADFLGVLESGFNRFLDQHGEELKSEYLLPDIVDRMIQNGEAVVHLLETPDRWFGMTYQEDTEAVREAFAKFAADGVYPKGINR